jgi:SAM-dependent methyltransferase
VHLYTDLASWWPLISPLDEYEEEAAFFLEVLGNGERRTLLELGAGGGSLAHHLAHAFELTLSDVSPDMVAVSRATNPQAEHVVGDMRSLRLPKRFDVVLVHDAIMYATTAADVRATLATAAHHCHPGGTVVVAPDCVRETFAPETSTGGGDAPDGRGARYLEWTIDADPEDDVYETLYALVLREANGAARVELDRHVEGMFALDRWLSWFTEAQLPARVVRDHWGRDVFVATTSSSATLRA